MHSRFLQWLYQQKTRTDQIGEFSNWFLMRPEFESFSSRASIRNFLASNSYLPGALKVFDCATQEFDRDEEFRSFVPTCQRCQFVLNQSNPAEVVIVWPLIYGHESGLYDFFDKPCFAKVDRPEWGIETIDRFLNPAHGYKPAIPKNWLATLQRMWAPVPGPNRSQRLKHAITAIDKLEEKLRQRAVLHHPGKAGYVYIIEAVGTTYFKIGHGINAQARLRLFQTGCPFPLRLLREITTRDRTALEQQLHARYAQYRHLGEWFALPSEVLQKLLEEDFQ